MMMKKVVPTWNRVLLLALPVGTAVILSFYRLLGSAEGPTNRRDDQEPPAVLRRDLVQNDFFASPFMMDKELMALYNEMAQTVDPFGLRGRGFFQPQYAITEDDTAVTVMVAVPNSVLLSEIVIEIIDGSVMHIQGNHKDDHSAIHFEKQFALGRHMNLENIDATLSTNGELVISTPKVTAAGKAKGVRKIDIRSSEL